MQFEPKIIPEGINTSDENPLKEFFLLVGASLLIILSISAIALAASDYLIRYIPIEKEQHWFSSQTIDDTLTKDSSSKNETIIQVEDYLQKLTDQLQDDEHSAYTFNVQLLDEATPNAFITVGGNIFVTRGLLKTVSSENALAMVLGHEMGHQYHRHPLRGAGRGIILVLAFLAVGGFEGNEITQSFIGQSAVLANLAFSREQEREADDEGVQLLINRYGHAQGASEFFRQIEQSEQSDLKNPVFLRTHPGTKERISFLESHEKAMKGEITPLPDFVSRYAEGQDQ